MKLAVRLAVPALALAALAGCSPSPSTAAVVDGMTITQAQAAEGAAACKETFPLVTESVAVQALVYRELVFKATRNLGTPLEEAKLNDVIKQNPQIAGLEDTKCWTVVQGLFLLDELPVERTTPEAQEALRQIPLEVNPRYGSFDPTQGWDKVGGSLSVLSEK
ncbi:MAG: hypothetical protein Q4D96_02090 [Propionibacteriaceae bacterium]|nr:hypothetical protein [Propionibacteriaceae bacterium]